MSKKLFLEEREKGNIFSRKNLLSQLDYQCKLIQNDLEIYITQTVYPRLGIKLGTKTQLADDLSSIEIVEEEKNEQSVKPNSSKE